MIVRAIREGSEICQEMALFMVMMAVGVAGAASTGGEMALANVTRFAPGDLFSLVGK